MSSQNDNRKLPGRAITFCFSRYRLWKLWKTQKKTRKSCRENSFSSAIRNVQLQHIHIYIYIYIYIYSTNMCKASIEMWGWERV